ncbi:hypothetical protein BKA81DRAFT_214510 [Phyllosticta paracitricarpa]|uniref:Uncharacterized protein n=1 Tax=Phyllosticta paracitricarpa TaxID=2016321 RepID=A0ABR1MWH5_9PEZI
MMSKAVRGGEQHLWWVVRGFLPRWPTKTQSERASERAAVGWGAVAKYEILLEDLCELTKPLRCEAASCRRFSVGLGFQLFVWWGPRKSNFNLTHTATLSEFFTRLSALSRPLHFPLQPHRSCLRISARHLNLSPFLTLSRPLRHAAVPLRAPNH